MVILKSLCGATIFSQMREREGERGVGLCIVTNMTMKLIIGLTQLDKVTETSIHIDNDTKNGIASGQLKHV